MASKKVVMRTLNSIDVYDFKWEIHNFSMLHDSLRSAVFFPSPTVPVQFFIEIVVSHYEKSHQSKMVFYLQKCSDTCIPKTLRLKFKLQSFKSDGSVAPVNSSDPKSYVMHDKKTIVLLQIHSNHDYETTKYCFYTGLQDDILVLKCHFELYGHKVTTTSNASLQENNPCKNIAKLISDFGALYNSKMLSDLTIKIGKKTLRAHQAILAARSPVFQSMMENDWKESKSKCLTITDVDFNIFDSFLKYLYTGEIDDECFTTAWYLYNIADKYAVSSLQEKCGEVLAANLDVETACGVLELAYLHSDVSLKNKAVEYTSLHFSEIRLKSEWKKIIRDYPEVATEVCGLISATF